MIAVLAAAIGLPLIETHRPLAVVILVAGILATLAGQSKRYVP